MYDSNESKGMSSYRYQMHSRPNLPLLNLVCTKMHVLVYVDTQIVTNARNVAELNQWRKFQRITQLGNK